MKKKAFRALIEMGFIIFLFYANLLMGEYERSGAAQRNGFVWAVEDVLTLRNFAIALVSSFLGYIIFEFLRKKA
jgi:hypothetical protein